MPASDHLHPYQMKLFMQAKELADIRASDSPFSIHSLSESSSLYKNKLQESKEGTAHDARIKAKPEQQTLHQSIAKDGVRSPVQIAAYREDTEDGGEGPNWEEFLRNGHHRVAAAYDIDPEMYIPVQYTD